MVLTERVSHMMRPSRIVPFTITREECEQIYRKRLSESRFVPPEMASQETVSHFRPVYVPFWHYFGSGEGTSHGIDSKHRTESGYNYTDIYEVDVENKVSISGAYYDASSKFDDETAQALCFSDAGMVPFHPAYLAGVYAEAPDVDREACYNWLARNARVSFSNHLRRTGACRAAAFPPNFREEAELVLMPVWLLASRQGDSLVYTAVNGTSGDIRCDLPVSARRSEIIVGVITAVLAALFLLLNHFILLRPRITAAISCILAMVCWNVIGPFLNRLSRKRQTDDDLTRIMKRRADPDAKNEVDPDKMTPSTAEQKPVISMHVLGALAGTAAILAFIGLMTARNRLAFLDGLISDHSWVPAALTLTAGVLEGFIFKRLADLPKSQKIALILHMVLCGLLLFSGGIYTSAWFYALILANYALTVAVLVRGMRMHNQYVTRPVPFFGKEEDPA